jgi:hypothetical protein
MSLIDARNGGRFLRVSCDVHVQTFADTHGVGCAEDIVPRTTLQFDGEYTFIYDYPLQAEARFPHLLCNPTAADVLLIGALDYKRIYEEEDQTQPAPPMSVGNLANRGFSQGKYKVWGHDIGDLTFSEILIYPEARQIRFGVGS